jgi:hypothetical protein
MPGFNADGHSADIDAIALATRNRNDQRNDAENQDDETDPS